jgi:uncharacterized protein YndB with AHSA1/START domain
MVTVERLIDADVQQVWDLVGDLERWDRMLPTVRHVTRLDGNGPPGVGSRFEVLQPGLPRAVYEVTEWEPGTGFTWVSTSPGVRTTATHELRAEQGRTRLSLGIAWTGPLTSAVRLLVGAKTRRMVEQEADTFARLAESGENGDGGGAGNA